MKKAMIFFVFVLVLSSLGCLCCCGPSGGSYSGYDYDDYEYASGLDGNIKVSNEILESGNIK